MQRRTLLSLTVAGFPAIIRAASTQPLDDAMNGLINRYDIPGAALGIARAGRKAYAKGFGVADLNKRTAVTEDSRFRIASCSKPITAAATLRLVEQDKLTLDEPVLPKLKLTPLNGELGDSRWNQITTRQLLNHTAGWSKTASGDPMFKSPQICASAGIDGPADAKITVRYMLSRPLDFTPGNDFAYSNFGYCVLGRLIESITGQHYADAVHSLVLSPCKAGGMSLGRSLTALSNEVTYYQSGSAASVFPQLGSRAPWPYGSFSMEANDANGGWVASVNELLRFLMSMDERSTKPLLKAATLNAVANGASFYGLGWFVRPHGQGGRPDLWHMGGLPGCKSLMVRLGDGFDWAVLFNSPGSLPSDFDEFSTEVQNIIHEAARNVTRWD